MRVLVCGGRSLDANGYLDVIAELRELNAKRGPFLLVIHGCASGVDDAAEFWAKQDGIQFLGFRAEWDKYGDAAGPIRNHRMLTSGKPDLVIAFPGGKGTANMIAQAESAGIEVLKIQPRKRAQK